MLMFKIRLEFWKEPGGHNQLVLFQKVNKVQFTGARKPLAEYRMAELATKKSHFRLNSVPKDKGEIVTSI